MNLTVISKYFAGAMPKSTMLAIAITIVISALAEVGKTAVVLQNYDLRLMDATNYCNVGHPDPDTSAPRCRTASNDPEPCGFCKFPQNFLQAPKFIPSWCVCGPGESCRYARSDRQRKLHRYTCQDKSVSNDVQDWFAEVET